MANLKHVEDEFLKKAPASIQEEFKDLFERRQKLETQSNNFYQEEKLEKKSKKKK